ncbi:MAG: short-chain dehydrogenase [Bacteroidetes bacterium HGW-Bacteroidetes-1]|jgi:short-subunit dehydrogenase|nr:MAG: short-chain dehydrogenase [Bacteroidetes bacterium HGW-Bacteroidetes-1]
MDIIITGSSRGIGFELVKLFAQQSENRILAISRNSNNINQLRNESTELKDVIFPVSMDLMDDGFQNKIISIVEDYQFKPRILINNAGLLVHKPIEQLDGNDFDAMFKVNMKSPFLLIQSLLLYFCKNAHIINIGSMGGFQGSSKFSGLSLYSASKGALAIFTECLAEELKDKDIKVNCLALGAAQTEMLQEAFPGYKAPVSASSMAAFIHDFALSGHQYFNGKVLPVSLSTP